MADSDSVRAAAPRARRIKRRQGTSSERISEILENARERAESRDPTTASVGSGRQSQSPRPDADVGSADETTGIISRGSGQNYQAVQSGNGGTTSRSSIHRQPSRTASQEDVTQQRPPQAQSRNSACATTEPAEKAHWWGSLLGQFRSIELENKGSVARDHLALERTFLAWLRTSLAFASIGIAVTQLFRLNTTLTPGDDLDRNRTLRRMGKPLGSTFLGISILTLLLGARRYFVGQKWVLRGKFPASRGTIIILALVSLAIMLLSLVVVIVIHPKT